MKKKESEEVKESDPKAAENLTPAKIQYILLTDFLFRAPVFGLIVLAVLGGLAYFFVWCILNIIEPAIKNF